MARLDDEFRAVLAGDVLLLAVLVLFFVVASSQLKTDADSHPPGVAWPEPVEGHYAR